VIGKLFGKQQHGVGQASAAPGPAGDLAALLDKPEDAPVLATSTHMTARLFGSVVEVSVTCDSVNERVSGVLLREIGAVLDGGYNRLVLDFGECSMLTSAGIGMLITLRDRMKKSGGSLAIYAVSDSVMEVLKITKISTFVSCRATRQEAYAAVT